MSSDLTQSITPCRKRVLITGASGFFGRALINYLCGSDWDVDAVVRKSSGIDQPHVTELVIPDLASTTPDVLSALMSGADCVIHLAAIVPGKEGHATESAMEYMADNVGAAAAQANVRRMIVMSSVYAALAAKESSRARQYGRQKHAADLILQKYVSSQLSIIFIQPPVIYGPGMSGALAFLLKLIVRRIPLPFGCVKNTRYFISQNNLINLVMAILEETDAVWSKANGRKYAVTDGIGLSTPEFLNAVADRLSIKIFQIPIPVYLLRLAGKLIGKSEMVSGAVDSLTLNQNEELLRDFGWFPIHHFPDSLDEWLLPNDSDDPALNIAPKKNDTLRIRPH